MATVVVLMPSLSAPEPQTIESTRRLCDFSRCKCAAEGQEWAREAAKLAAQGQQKRIPRPERDFFHHPAECDRGKNHIVFSPSYSASILTWARNQTLADALKNHPSLDYVLWVDSDMVAPEHALDQLLAHDKAIVSAVCTKRTDPPVPVAKCFSEKHQSYAELREWPDEKGLIEVDAVGTAFLLMSRKVIEETALAYHEREYRTSGNGWWFEYLKTPNGGEFGEDVGWAWKATRLGHRIYLDTDLEVLHVGKYEFGLKDWHDWRQSYLNGEVGPRKDNLELVKV